MANGNGNNASVAATNGEGNGLATNGGTTTTTTNGTGTTVAEHLNGDGAERAVNTSTAADGGVSNADALAAADAAAGVGDATDDGAAGDGGGVGGVVGLGGAASTSSMGGDDAGTDAGASSLPPSEEAGGRPPLDTACSDGGGGPSSLGGGMVGPPSPLTGCYLLIVLGEPHSEEHKDNILQHLLKGECEAFFFKSIFIFRETKLQIWSHLVESQLSKPQFLITVPNQFTIFYFRVLAIFDEYCLLMTDKIYSTRHWSVFINKSVILVKKTTFRVSETDYNFVFPTSEVLLGVDIGILHQELTEFRQFGNLYNFESNWVFPIPYFICFLPQFENKILIFFQFLWRNRR